MSPVHRASPGDGDGQVSALTVETAVRDATRELQRAGVASPRVDAELLLAHVLGTDRAQVAHRRLLGQPITALQHQAYRDIVGQRSLRLPLQHLTGVADFAGLRLRVGPGVFVPRPETEVLLERARALLHGVRDAVVVDLCSGSGAIALAIRHRVPSASVYAVELSELAAAWAQHNIETLGLDVRLRNEAAQSSCADLLGQVDLVTCNPPYVPREARPVDPEVAEHDPEMALYGEGADGLVTPVAMAERAAALLRPGGRLLLEHGERQRSALSAAIERSGAWSSTTGHDDLNERPRFLEAVRAERQ